MNNRTFKCAFLILIVSTIFSYVYLGVCTKVSLATNISTSIFNNNIIDSKDNEITIEYSNLNNYYNEKETKIKIYFNKDRYSNLNVLNLYNKINKEAITRNKIEYISTYELIK